MMIDVIIHEIQSVKTKLHPNQIIFYCSGSILLVSLMLITRYRRWWLPYSVEFDFKSGEALKRPAAEKRDLNLRITNKKKK